MPTAAKLVAAIALALAAYGVAGVLLYRTEILQEQGISFKFFAFMGLLVGWMKLGPAAERGYRAGWSGGIGAAVGVYFFCVLLATCHYVYVGMGYHAFNNVDDLVDGFMTKAAEYALYITDWPIFVAAIFGGMLAGTFLQWRDVFGVEVLRQRAMSV